jgi:hypothetical protein
MSRLWLGLICGVVFGIIDVLLMIPIQFPPEKNKDLAMTGAFVSCVVIGFVVGIAKMPLPGWLAGVFIGLAVNLPVAIITTSYIPILPVSAVGGAVIGFVVDRWGN